MLIKLAMDEWGAEKHILDQFETNQSLFFCEHGRRKYIFLSFKDVVFMIVSQLRMTFSSALWNIIKEASPDVTHCTLVFPHKMFYCGFKC